MNDHVRERKRAAPLIASAVITVSCLFVVTALLTPTAVAQLPQSYPMVCRGGGEMVVNISNRARRLTIRFRSAGVGAATRQPGPGECAWLDRPLRQGEPRALSYQGYKINLTLSISADRRIRSLSVGGDARSRLWNDLVQAVMNGRVFYVHAFNDSKLGSLVVTRVGP